MKIPWDSPRDFMLASVGDSSECNSYSNFTIMFLSYCNVLCYNNVTFSVNTGHDLAVQMISQWSRLWFLSGVTDIYDDHLRVIWMNDMIFLIIAATKTLVVAFDVTWTDIAVIVVAVIITVLLAIFHTYSFYNFLLRSHSKHVN